LFPSGVAWNLLIRGPFPNGLSVPIKDLEIGIIFLDKSYNFIYPQLDLPYGMLFPQENGATVLKDRFFWEDKNDSTGIPKLVGTNSGQKKSIAFPNRGIFGYTIYHYPFL